MLFINPRKRFMVFALLTSFLLLTITLRYRYQFQNALSYASRPLWDTPDGPRHVLEHYHAEGIDFDHNLCALHGWAARREPLPEVWDAIMVSSEMDLLEIRLHELDSVVDKFFIIESDKTFTGINKPLVFAQNRDRFAKFGPKIVYNEFQGRVPGPNEHAFDVESDQRRAMSASIEGYLTAQGPRPLVIFADVDEIPSAATIRLLKTCEFPSPLHLQLKNYMYSFEWPYGADSWRAQVHQWAPGTFYRHSMAGEYALADAGWHCSFCFRELSEFSAKMQGYSHYDRIGGDESLLTPNWIQKAICEGKDIFKMLPEAYTYADLIALMNPRRSKSAVGLPRHLIQNAEKFRFLLPGGCLRQL